MKNYSDVRRIKQRKSVNVSGSLQSYFESAQWGSNLCKFGEDISPGCISWLEHPTLLLLSKGPEEAVDYNSAPTVVHIYLVPVTISGPSWSTASRFVDSREAPWEPVEWFINGSGWEGWDECKFQATWTCCSAQAYVALEKHSSGTPLS